jgi:hypothetical protein
LPNGVIALNITPFTSILENEDPHFVGFIGMCAMLGDVDV